MMKLSDEILSIELEFADGSTPDYVNGFEHGISEAAKLAKKYDAEIERLNNLLAKKSKIGDKFY